MSREQLREVLSVDQGEGRGEGTHAALRARFVEAALAPPKERRVPRMALAIAASAAVSALALWLVLGNLDSRGPLFGGLRSTSVEVGAYYAGGPTGDTVLHFEDGSRVTLQEQSGLRVQKVSRPETIVLMERGAARFDVRHDPRRIWRVAAGPYVVRVTGTSLTVEWASESGQLIVQMHEGSVRVSGPDLPEEVVLSGEERLVTGAITAVPDSDAAESEAVAPQDSVEPPPTAAPTSLEPVDDAGTRTPAPRGPGTRAARAEPSFAEWLARGEPEQVVLEAERRGVDSVLHTAPATELRALADAARYRGRDALARSALGALRERFPGTAQGTAAAFVLGRLDDASGEHSRALSWYETYLAEGGPLAPEARGRRMVTLHKLGRSAEAQARAREYLERHPDGAYADHARDIAP
jgi:hypothetical protein